MGSALCQPCGAAVLLASLTVVPAFAQGSNPDSSARPKAGVARDVGSATPKAQNAFGVGNIILGTKPVPSELREFQCKPSDQFAGFDWCQTGNLVASNNSSSRSLLRKQDGTVVYVSQSVMPSALGLIEGQAEVSRLSARYSESARTILMPHRSGSPDAIIAYWGKVELNPLRDEAVSMLAVGNPIREGLLLDFLGDFRKSARFKLPIYRLSGGPGYVWSAS